AVRLAECLLERLLGAPGAQKIKDAEALLGAGRSVEPRLERPASIRHLTDAETKRIGHTRMIAAEPGEPQIVRPIARKLVLMRRRETGNRTLLGFRDHGPMADGDWPIHSRWIKLRVLHAPFRIHPGHAPPTG